MNCWIRCASITLLGAMFLAAQPNPPLVYVPRPAPQQGQPARPQQGQQPAQPQAAQPQAAQPQAAQPQAAQPGQPQPAQPQPNAPAPGAPSAQPPATPRATMTEAGGFLLDNVSLLQLIDILAKRLKINYILDPRFKGGSVTIHTYGEVRPTELMPLLQTILRMNGGAIVQVGDLYRIVPVNSVSQLPIRPTVNGKDFADDERMVFNMIFLKYTTATEVSKLLEPFLGEGFKMSVYEPANLIMLLDTSRSMRRTMELIALFDSDSFAGQRVRLFSTRHSQPSDLVKELDSVFKAYALSEKNAAVRFIPIDRINTVIGVAPNPGIFTEVERWVKKLDAPAKTPAGAINNFVYRLKYGRAETIAMAIMGLYTGQGMMMGYGMGMMGMGTGYGGMGMGMGMGYGGMGYGGMGYGGMGYGGMGYGGMGYGGMGYGGMGYGGMGYGGMGYGGMGYGGMGYGGMGYGSPLSISPSGNTTPPATTTASGTTGTDLTGRYLGSATGSAQGAMARIPHVIPNPFDNTLLVQGTPQEWEQIKQLLEQLDIPPRQVLIEAKIYEVDLTGQFQGGVESYLQKLGESFSSATGGSGSSGTGSGSGSSGGSVTVPFTRSLLGAASGSGLQLSSGLLVGHSRELLAVLTAQEQTTRAKVISAPSVVATDSIPASIQVGQSVPTLSSQAVSGVQSGGSSLFTNTINNQSTGVGLNIMARVNSSGIVTLMINQSVSAPQPTTTSSIQSPSFSQRTVQTQVTVQDGDTIAIGGIIQEDNTWSSSGIPFLHRLPVVGMAFGSKSANKARTELVVFLTPRVIYDTNQVVEASDDLSSQLKHLQKLIREKN